MIRWWTRSTRRAKLTLALAGLLLLSGWGACTVLAARQWPREPEQVRAMLEREIPPGTPTSRAREAMEMHAFNCDPVRRGDWVDIGSYRNYTAIRTNIDYLFCSRRDAELFLHIVWYIGFTEEGGAVKEILIRRDLIGL